MSHRSRSLFLLIALLAGTAQAQDLDQARKEMLAEATTLVTDLQRGGRLTFGDGGWQLPVQLMVQRFGDEPQRMLDEARKLPEPFQASIALGAMAAQRITNEPAAAEKILLEAFDRAMAIDHWTGRDATSLPYLFQLIRLFDKERSLRLLTAAHEHLRKWPESEYQKSKAMAELSRLVIELDPQRVDPLLDELIASSQSNHYWESIQRLGRFDARRNMERTRQQATEFLDSGKPWPSPSDPLHAALIEYAMDDLPRTRTAIRAPQGTQERALALFYVAQALIDANRHQEAAELLDEIEQLPAEGDDAMRIKDYVAKGRYSLNLAPQTLNDAVERFLAAPNVDLLQEMANTHLPMIFPDRAHAARFLEAASPLVAKMHNGMGYPHHGAPQSMMQGRLALIAAQLGRLPEARQHVAQIEHDELKALYLLEVCQVLRPLPPVLNDWPFRPLVGAATTIQPVHDPE